MVDSEEAKASVVDSEVDLVVRGATPTAARESEEDWVDVASVVEKEAIKYGYTSR